MNMKGTRCFLLFSGIIFITVGLLMGLSTPLFLNEVFGALVQLNELHIFRAIMGVYVALGFLYIYGFFSVAHVHIILNVELVIVTGLIGGCSYSLLVDGYYHWTSVAALLIDIVLFVFCIFFLFKPSLKKE